MIEENQKVRWQRMAENKEIFTNFAGFQCLEQLHNNSTGLYLSTCGVQNCPPGYSYGPGIRDIYIIHFICEGKGRYEVHDTAYHLRKGDFFVIYPGTEVFYQADEKDPWDYIWVGFQGIKAETYLGYAGIDREHLIGHCCNTAYMLSCIQQMTLARVLTHYNELRRQAALLQIFAALIEQHHEQLTEEEQLDYPHHIYIDQTLDYVQTHISENIRIQDIANYIGIDRSYLTSIFKKALGMSPQEYLLNYRMEYACELLKDPQAKIATIAREVGYQDPLAFSKVFKKHMNLSPSQWRAEHSG